MEYELRNHKNFVCLANDTTDEEVPVNKQEREQSKNQGDEVNLIEEGEEPQPVFLSANLSTELKQAVLILLREFLYVLA